MGVLCTEEREKLLEINPSFFSLKGVKHRLCVSGYPPWVPAKGGWCRLESREQCLDWEAWGRALGEQLWDFWGLDILGLHSSHLS